VTHSAIALLEGYRNGELSPVEVVDASLARIDALDPELLAMPTLCAERARAEAAACERAYRDGRPQGPLAGVPFVVKDLFDSADVPTAYGSPMFAGHTPSADAAVVRNVRDAGAILLGKSQTHEFAWGITSVNERMGTSHNPWDRSRISGGSSGGSAVALAAGYVPIAIGSDTGGSIRVPSGYCGTVGFKPSFGRLSTEGVWPLAPSLDHPGAMARTPADVGLLFRAMEGRDEPPAPSAALSGRTVGICPELQPVPLAADVQVAFDDAVRTVTDLGARVEEVSLPEAEAEAIYPTFGVIQRAEAHRTHTEAGLWPARAADFGADVRGRLELGEQVTLRDYLEATLARERARAAMAALLQTVDVLLTPIAACSPPPIGQDRVQHAGSEREFRDLVMPSTVPHDLLGLPTCAVRAGFDELNIPVGVQFSAGRWGDDDVLSAARAFVEATPELQERWPELALAEAESQRRGEHDD
jgi:aspartyl-tRNA(Asn)/glutamyl-tRNA(Gln) amidotransferase subunit A